MTYIFGKSIAASFELEIHISRFYEVQQKAWEVDARYSDRQDRIESEDVTLYIPVA